MMNYLLVILNVVLLISGQTLWKIGIGKVSITGLGSVLWAMLSPWIIAGIVIYVVATVISIYLLKQLPLSLVYPMQSLAYVFAVLVGILIFHEHVSAWRWAGVAIILIGVGFIVK